MMNEQYDEQYVIEILNNIKNTPPRNEEKAALTKAHFLSEVKTLSNSKIPVLPVSQSHLGRLNKWIKDIHFLSVRKERFSMVTTFTTIMTILTLVIGGTGATVYAAQNSLPDDFLYPVKIASEDFRMQISSQTQTQFELAIEFTNRRAEELAGLVENDKEIPPELITQFQNQLQTAFQIAASMNDDDLIPALLKLRATIRQQQHLLAGISEKQNEPILSRIRENLRLQEQLCTDGLSDPLLFRIRIRQQKNGDVIIPTNQSTAPGPNATQGTSGQINQPSNGAGPNSNSNATQIPDELQPGNEACPECTPVQDGTGPGPGPDAGPGEGSDVSSPPQDGSGAGPGPNENPGSAGNTDNEPGNDSEPSQENPGNGNSNDNNDNSNNPSSPGAGNNNNGGGGKGNP